MLWTCLSAFPSLGCTEGGMQDRENCPLPKAHRVPELTLPGGSLVWGGSLWDNSPLGVWGEWRAMLVKSVLSLQMAKVPCTMVSVARGSAT